MTKVEKWAQDLWDEYNKFGQITTSDVKRVCGKTRSYIYRAFNSANIEGPPVFDARKKRLEERSEALWEKAKEMGRDFLSGKEFAEVLDIPRDNTHGYHKTLVNNNMDIPRIVFRGGWVEDAKMPERIDRSELSKLPGGLPVASCRRLTDGRIAYMLK